MAIGTIGFAQPPLLMVASTTKEELKVHRQSFQLPQALAKAIRWMTAQPVLKLGG